MEESSVLNMEQINIQIFISPYHHYPGLLRVVFERSVDRVSSGNVRGVRHIPIKGLYPYLSVESTVPP